MQELKDFAQPNAVTGDLYGVSPVFTDTQGAETAREVAGGFILRFLRKICG
jgi:hypothetical protein